MNRNVGVWDRGARAVVAVGLAVAAIVAPLALPIRLAVFGGGALYLLFTALAGTCVGYRLIGRSTCPAGQGRS